MPGNSRKLLSLTTETLRALDVVDSEIYNLCAEYQAGGGKLAGKIRVLRRMLLKARRAQAESLELLVQENWQNEIGSK